MSMCLPLKGKQHLTLFSIYAPTLLADPADKDIFYSNLWRLLNNTPEDKKVLILGNFNARVGKNSEAWQGVLGRHGVGNCSDNRRLLLKFCIKHQLTIINTIFKQKDLLSKKRAAHQTHLTQPTCHVKKATFLCTCSILQCKLREIQNDWWAYLAMTTELCADIGDFRGFYEALKAVYGPHPTGLESHAQFRRTGLSH